MPGITIEAGKAHQALGDIQRADIYEIQMGDVPAALASFTEQLSDLTNEEVTDLLKWQARSVTIPQITNQPIETNILGVKRKFPGQSNMAQTLDITFDEYVGNRLTKFLDDWFNAVTNYRNETAGFGLSEGSSRDSLTTDFTIITGKANGGASGVKYVFKNVWIESFTPGSLSNDNGATLQPSATFSFDFQQLEDNS